MEGQIANDNYYFSFFTKEKDKNRIESILNNIVSDRIKIKYEDINENTKVIVTKKPNILFDYQTKEIAKNIISGDVIHCKERDNGNSSFIICDGMGKGLKAKEESENTIKLVNKLLTSNLSSFCICQLINYYKKVRDEERFRTLDYLEINPFTKKGYLYKQGSATTYIFKNDKRVIKIENKNLPLGKEEEINERKISFEEGDVVFLASDGLFDNVYNEKGLIEYIKTLLYMPSEQIVYYLLDYSVKLKGITKDDISVICIKIL